jgi:hypothetical protein
MIARIILVFSLSFLGNKAHCSTRDTITFWHISYFNDTLKLNQYMEGTKLEIDSDQIEETDSLSAQVWFCVGQIGIEYLIVLDKENEIVTSKKQGFNNRRFEAMKISLNELLKYSEKTGEEEFDLYYTITGTEIIYSTDQLYHLGHLILN